VPHLVAAPDKFRATATARAAAAAMCGAAASSGWTADPCPMSDGGEGFVDVLGGAVRTTTVRGPLGHPVAARWALRDDGTAILESAAAVGRALLSAPKGEDPVTASTEGVGELLAAALAEGATSIVVGCGGTASTDGGRGCVEVLEGRGLRLEVPLVVACDVDAGFLDAARRFGPQKGATPEQVARLGARLDDLAARYHERYGVDVTAVRGAGAAGGLAGGLVALGGTVVSGARLVADELHLARRLAAADAVVTGEGRLDEGTLSGKVVAVVLDAAGATPALVVAGRVDRGAARALRAGAPVAFDVVELDDAVQRRDGTPAAIAGAVAGWLGARA
jgi:glycerate kinase